MNTRSITCRLAAWCASIFLLICLSFGLYTYLGLDYYLRFAHTDTPQGRVRTHSENGAGLGLSIVRSAGRRLPHQRAPSLEYHDGSTETICVAA